MHFKFVTRRIKYLKSAGVEIGSRGRGAMVVLFCKRYVAAVLGNISFYKGNE